MHLKLRPKTVEINIEKIFGLKLNIITYILDHLQPEHGRRDKCGLLQCCRYRQNQQERHQVCGIIKR